MASAQSHHAQYRQNREFAHSLLQQETPRYDWVVTIAFYAALHLVDKVIVSKNQSVKPDDHKTRNFLVGTVQELKQIRTQYMSLQQMSHQSRYLCVPFNKGKASSAIKLLETIEKQLVR